MNFFDRLNLQPVTVFMTTMIQETKGKAESVAASVLTMVGVHSTKVVSALPQDNK